MISSRKDLVATGFAGLSMSAYLRYRRQGRGWGWWYAGAVVAFLLASAGKQSVLLLPAVMLVWDVLVDKRRSWQMLADKVPLGLITLFFGWMTWHAQPSTGQTLNPLVMAVSEFTNLWLLTGLGQYVLYRPAPVPEGLESDGPVSDHHQRSVGVGSASLVCKGTTAGPRDAVLLDPDPNGAADAAGFHDPYHRPLPVPALGRRMPAAGGTGRRVERRLPAAG